MRRGGSEHAFSNLHMNIKKRKEKGKKKEKKKKDRVWVKMSRTISAFPYCTHSYSKLLQNASAGKTYDY